MAWPAASSVVPHDCVRVVFPYAHTLALALNNLSMFYCFRQRSIGSVIHRALEDLEIANEVGKPNNAVKPFVSNFTPYAFLSYSRGRAFPIQCDSVCRF